MKKNVKKILGVTLAACMAATSLAGCSGFPGKQTTAAPAAGESGAGTGQAAQSTATGEPIKVGVSNMVTGPMAAGGIRMKQAITMAFEEINANGGGTLPQWHPQPRNFTERQGFLSSRQPRRQSFWKLRTHTSSVFPYPTAQLDQLW